MDMLEWLRENLETTNETGLASLEMVDMTGIGGFENSGFTTNEGIADYVRDTIPLTHLENCPNIQYEQGHDPTFPHASGTFERGSHEIHIWGEVIEPSGIEGVKETMTHEIGHNVHENIMSTRPEVAARWEALHEQSKESNSGFVSNYASKDHFEDFAETYMTYTLDPEKLKFDSSEKYEFMKQEVFFGREYAPRVLAGYHNADGTYHWVSDNTDTDPETGEVVRQW